MQIRDTGEGIRYSVAQTLARSVRFLPQVIGAIIFLIVCWIASDWLATLLMR